MVCNPPPIKEKTHSPESKKVIKQFGIRAAILVPNFNNPDSSLTDDSAKQKIAEILAQQNIPVVKTMSIWRQATNHPHRIS